MSRTYFTGGACCPPRTEGIIYLKMGADQVMVGMMGLETVFQQLRAMGRRPDETTDTELVGMARKFNYIPANAAVEANYAATLREAYAHFCTRGEKDERQAL